MAERVLYTVLITLLLDLQALKAQNQWDCDFENGFCEWSTGPDSDGNWTRSLVKSNTPQTGPSTGHTLDINNYYIYLYARDFRADNGLIEPGKSCVLDCPDFDTGSEGGCFRFWYHMYGIGIGSLAFVVRQGTTSGSPMFERNGDQSPDWNCGTFAIAANQTNLTIQITATTGDNVRGDIALDDFKYYHKQCDLIPDACSAGLSTTESLPIISSSTATTTDTTTLETTSTTLQPTTTTGQAPDDSWIIYVAIVPVAIAIVGGVIAFCVFKLRKRPVPNIPDDVTDTHHEPVIEDEPEVYHDLDEMQMNEFTDSGGYTLPSNNGFTPSNNNISNGSTNYLKMSTKVNEAHVEDEDTSSLHSNYVEAMQEPIGSHQPNSPGDNNGDLGSSSHGFNAGQDSRTATPKHGSNTGIPKMEFRPGAGNQGGGREGSTQDFDEENAHPPPPSCGPTMGYIRPVFEM